MFRKLETIFNQLHLLTVNSKEYKPIFRFGTEDDLQKYLKVKRRTGERYYPLIWLETPTVEAGELDLNFVIATLNMRTDMGNFDRLTYTMEPTLDPLFTNIVTAIKGSRVFKFAPELYDKNYRGEKHFNYLVTPDIWDAISFTFSLQYTRECEVKLPINF